MIRSAPEQTFKTASSARIFNARKSLNDLWFQGNTIYSHPGAALPRMYYYCPHSTQI